MKLLDLLIVWICTHIHSVVSQGVAPPPTAKKKNAEPKDEGDDSDSEKSKTGEPNEDRKPKETASHYRESVERNIEVTDADFYCLDGFQLNSALQRCERNDDQQSDLGCPLGWDFRNNECQTTEVSPADRYCLDGYQEVLGRCQRVMEAPKQLICPPAYNHTEFGCVKDVETDPIVQCLEGELINGACATLVEAVPVVQCEPGFDHFGDHCGRKLIEPVRYQCPPGFVEQKDRCIEIETVEPLQACPAGTSIRDGLCHARLEVAPVNECSVGTLDTLINMCTTEVMVGPTEQCPPGAEPLGEVCLLEQHAEPELSCPPNSVPSEIHGCMGKGPLPPSKSCPPGYSLRDKGTCHRRLTLPRELVCPPAYQLKQGQCVAVEYVVPQPRCPENSIALDKSCWQIQTFLPENVCPENLLLDTQNNYCYGEVQTPRVPLCERGTYDEVEKACVLAEIAPSALTCPPASRMVHGVCQERVITSPRVACPHDFTLEEHGSRTVCLGRALAEGELGCIKPYQDAGDNCVFNEVVPKMIGCLNGGHLKGTACIQQQSQKPVVLCADGYAYDEYTQLCKKLLWARPVPICPKGFVYDNLVQKCYKLKKKGESGPAKKPGEENLLPLEVQPENTTTSTKKIVKAKIRPQAGKEQFIPMATFTGPDAVKQAGTLETLKLANAASGQSPQNVLTPPVST